MTKLWMKLIVRNNNAVSSCLCLYTHRVSVLSSDCRLVVIDYLFLSQVSFLRHECCLSNPDLNVCDKLLVRFEHNKLNYCLSRFLVEKQGCRVGNGEFWLLTTNDSQVSLDILLCVFGLSAVCSLYLQFQCIYRNVDMGPVKPKKRV